MGTRIDVVVPTFGNEALTIDCFESLSRCQGVEDLSVIWVDNGSSDESQHAVFAALRRLRLHFSQITLPENRGFVKATNQGMHSSRAPFVCLLNNDTRAPADLFVKLLDVMKREEDVGIVGPLSSCPGEWQGDHQHVLSWPPQEGREGYRVLYWTGAMLAFFCALLRQRMVQEIGLLAPEFGVGLADDDDYCMRARRAGWRLALRFDTIVEHRHRSTFSQLFTPEQIEQMSRRNLEIYKRKWR